MTKGNMEIVKLHECEVVRYGLNSLPDDLPLSSIREEDYALKELLEEYRNLSSKNTGLPEMTDENTMIEFKEALCHLDFTVRLKLIHDYLSGTGKLTSEDDYERQFKNLKILAIKWGLAIIAFLFTCIVIAVVSVGLARDNIDSNNMINGFISLVRHLADIFFTQ